MSAQGWWISILLGRQAGDPCSPLQTPKGRVGTCNLTPDPNSFTPGPNSLGAARPPPGLLGLAP